MDRLTAMAVFVRIVETGSFSAVARDLGMTQPTVSKQLSALERQLKTRLLNRSTRQLSLTEAGSAYYESSKRIIDAVREADGNLGQLQTQLTGNERPPHSFDCDPAFCHQSAARRAAARRAARATIARSASTRR